MMQGGPGWLLDGSIVIAIITSVTSIITLLISKSSDAKLDRDKRGMDDIKFSIENINSNMSLLTQQVNGLSTQNQTIMDGTRKIQRMRLFQDLRRELEKGFTSLSMLRELSILFESYKNLGGNGEIEVLFDKYKELPVKEDTHA